MPILEPTTDLSDALVRANRVTYLAEGVNVPADGSGGYAAGCLFIKTNGGATTNLYKNDGTVLSSQFSALN